MSTQTAQPSVSHGYRLCITNMGQNYYIWEVFSRDSGKRIARGAQAKSYANARAQAETAILRQMERDQ